MKEDLVTAFLVELERNGFVRDNDLGGSAMMSLSYLREVDVLELLDILIVRREKIFRSVEVVGEETASQNFEEVQRIIFALKATLRSML